MCSEYIDDCIVRPFFTLSIGTYIICIKWNSTMVIGNTLLLLFLLVIVPFNKNTSVYFNLYIITSAFRNKMICCRVKEKNIFFKLLNKQQHTTSVYIYIYTHTVHYTVYAHYYIIVLLLLLLGIQLWTGCCGRHQYMFTLYAYN